MRLISPFVVAIALTACAGAAPPLDPTARPTTPDAGPSVDLGFLDQYGATRGFRVGRPGSIRITRDGSEIFFLRADPAEGSRALYRVSTASGEERLLLSASQLLDGTAESLSQEERDRRERMRLSARGLTSFILSPDETKLLIPFSGEIYLVDRATREVTTLPTGAYPIDPTFSPDGDRVACVRDSDLYVIELSSGTQRRLTTRENPSISYGVSEFIAQEEMGRYRGYWWSPDSSSLLVQRTDTSPLETLHTFDPMHPETPAQGRPYPRAGTANAEVTLGIVPAVGGAVRALDWDRASFPYLAQASWPQDGRIVLLVQDRHQQRQQLLALSPEGAAVNLLLEERDDAWLNLDQSVPRWLDDGGFLWTTERRGAWQLERRSADGSLVAELTGVDFGFQSLGEIDEEAGFAWVRASDDPTESHLWRVPIGGSGAGPQSAPERVTTRPGAHSLSSEGSVWVHAYTNTDAETTWTIRRGPDEQLGELRSLAVEPPWRANVEFLVVGERELHASVVRPHDFDPNRRYPVLVSVYGGPHVTVVRRGSGRYRMQQWYANHGFIVVSIDGRGTPSRGRAWERAIRDDFISLPLQDQVDGLQALGERFEEMDLDRVGIYGWSFGGYFSAMAVMQRPDVFHAGIAGAPVADWADYDTHYTERYIGLPQENAEAYRRSSVLTYAAQLERPLLIIHGTADDNVYFVHAIKMSQALLRADREHDFLPLAGFTHMVRSPEITRGLTHSMLRFFQTHLAGGSAP